MYSNSDIFHFFQEYFYLSFSASDVNNSGTPLHKGDKVEFYVATDKRYAPVTKSTLSVTKPCTDTCTCTLWGVTLLWKIYFNACVYFICFMENQFPKIW